MREIMNFRRVVFCVGLILTAALLQACAEKKEAAEPGAPQETPTQIASTPQPVPSHPTAPAVAETPATPTQEASGNLLKNADFTWKNSWISPWNKDPWGKVTVSETTEQYNGKPAIQFTPPGDTIGLIYQVVPTADLQIKPGDKLTGSVSLRAEAPDAIDLVFYVKTSGQQLPIVVKNTYYGNGEWATVEMAWSPANADQAATEVKFCVWAREASTKPVLVSNPSLTVVRAGR